MQLHFAVFHLGLHFLPKYSFRGFQYGRVLKGLHINNAAYQLRINGVYNICVENLSKFCVRIISASVISLCRKKWYTSGIVNNINTGDLRWEGDGSMIQQDMQWWFSTADRFKEGRRIVYTSSG